MEASAIAVPTMTWKHRSVGVLARQVVVRGHREMVQATGHEVREVRKVDELDARDALIKLIQNLRDRGSAIVLATHDEDLRTALADRVLEVSHGNVT